MPKAFYSSTGGIHTCPECGARYDVSYTTLPARDDDYAVCQCCNKKMADWRDTTVPSFTLIGECP